MPEHRNLARGENEWFDTYGNLGMMAPAQLMRLPLAVLDPWQGPDGEAQPFRPYTPAMLEDLAENIRQHGVIQPITVRPRPNGRFQIIAGHNRVAASKLAGLTTIPALVQNLDDDQAAIVMIDSNLKTRPYILPSERAFSYRMRLEAMNRRGQRPISTFGPVGQNSEGGTANTTTFGPVGQKYDARSLLASQSEDSARQIQRYIRLTYLHPALLDMVDNGSLDKEKQDKNKLTMALRAGVELSYLTIDQQLLLLQVIAEAECKAPSMSQATQLHQLASAQELDEPAIWGVLVKAKAPKANTIKLPAGRISSFFPPNTSPEQMEAEIYKALLAYQNTNAHASN